MFMQYRTACTLRSWNSCIESAAGSFCRELSDQKGVIIDFSCGYLPHAVPNDVSLCLFRVLQEALHNAVKYSGVKSFVVQLNGASNEIHLTVRDSGAGFDPAASINGRGLGLISMRERVSLVKGTITIVSKIMGGTEISVRVPIKVDDGASNYLQLDKVHKKITDKLHG